MSTIQDTDLLLVNRGGTDYQTTAAEFKEYVTAVPPMPWEGYDGGIFHVKNATGRVAIYASQGWDVTPNGDGTYSWSNERLISDFNSGDEIVFIAPPGKKKLFGEPDNYNYPQNWEFGELTDTSKVTSFREYFRGCLKFNSDIGWWDTSAAVEMNHMFSSAEEFDQDISGWDVSNVGEVDPSSKSMLHMFSGARKFNQDLSKWCVRYMTTKPSTFDYHADAWTKARPVWGTCPRGEDQP